MRWYHTEIVYAVDSKTICSIGGNVGEIGNRDGDRVGGKCRQIAREDRWTCSLYRSILFASFPEDKLYSSRLHLTDSESSPGLGR